MSLDLTGFDRRQDDEDLADYLDDDGEPPEPVEDISCWDEVRMERGLAARHERIARQMERAGHRVDDAIVEEIARFVLTDESTFDPISRRSLYPHRCLRSRFGLECSCNDCDIPF